MNLSLRKSAFHIPDSKSEVGITYVDAAEDAVSRQLEVPAMTELVIPDFPLLSLQGNQLQPTYTTADAARIFGVSPRTIQAHVAKGALASRALMGRGRFMSCDLEAFLNNSVKSGRADLHTSAPHRVISPTASRRGGHC
jgi:hypothetical protein